MGFKQYLLLTAALVACVCSGSGQALGHSSGNTASIFAADQRLIVVSIGDSYASGEGNPDRRRSHRQDAAWLAGNGADVCHRSNRNAHRRAFEVLMRDWRSATGNRSARFKSFACGGATINEGLFGSQGPMLNELMPPRCLGGDTAVPCALGQLDQLSNWMLEQSLSKGDIDVLMVSIGGNDMGLGELVQNAAGVFSEDFGFDESDIENAVQRERALFQNLTRLTAELKARFSPKRIVFVGYPEPLRDANGDFCDRHEEPRSEQHWAGAPVIRTANASSAELAWANAFVLRPLNMALEQLASVSDDVMFVRNSAEPGRFMTNGFCSGDARAFHTFGDSFLVQGDPFAGLHPNRRGTEMIKQRIVETLRPLLITPSVPIALPEVSAGALQPRPTDALKTEKPLSIDEEKRRVEETKKLSRQQRDWVKEAEKEANRKQRSGSSSELIKKTESDRR